MSLCLIIIKRDDCAVFFPFIISIPILRESDVALRFKKKDTTGQCPELDNVQWTHIHKVKSTNIQKKLNEI